MTEYVKSTNFASKDSLASGNPLKIVKGTEFDTEFNNIATAVATKADLINPALTGIPTAPTASAGTANTQIASTAFVATALQALYPVGSIYINAGVTTNPGTLLGFGTWTAFGAGRVLVGLNGSDTLFDTLEETGGSKDAVVVSHTHTASTAAAGAHTHSLLGNAVTGGSTKGLGEATSSGVMGSPVGGTYYATAPATGGDYLSTASDHTHSVTVDTAGSSGTNANLQPYVTVAMWKRTA